MTRGEAGRGVRSFVCAVTLALATSAAAADLPLKPAPKAVPASNTPVPATAPGPFAAPSLTCQEWTDGCRTCQRAPGGEASCSNVGIACVSNETECTRP
jgi:hypothetical protein